MEEHTHKPDPCKKFHESYPNPDNTCRVCKHILYEGEPRYNDWYIFRYDNEVINQPICGWCATNQPDNLHKRYLASPLVTRTL